MDLRSNDSSTNIQAKEWSYLQRNKQQDFGNDEFGIGQASTYEFYLNNEPLSNPRSQVRYVEVNLFALNKIKSV